MTWRLLACTLLAVAGCAEKQEPTVAEPNGTGQLLAYEAGNHLHRYGGRVFGDGRYELFSTSKPGPPPWKAYDPFTPEQVDEIGAAIDAALAANLPDEITDDVPPDATTARFNLRGREVVVAPWPDAAPPELEQILDRITELRRKAPVPSTWRLWNDGTVVELEASCDIGDVAALGSLRDAIFMASASSEAEPPAGDPPEGTPLVSITFANPKGDERLEVFADGRRVDAAPGGERERELTNGQLNAIRVALAATDWAALPSRLC